MTKTNAVFVVVIVVVVAADDDVDVVDDVAMRGELGGPCDSSGQCSAVNTVCSVGRCVCSEDYFQRNNTCGMYSLCRVRSGLLDVS